MNNKGQVLVMFVIIIPILLIAITLIIDYSLLSIEKRKINNNVYDAVEYYLSNSENDDIDIKLNKLLEENLKNIKDKKIDITYIDEGIKISVSKKYKSLYKIMSKDINVTYTGNISNKQIIKG